MKKRFLSKVSFEPYGPTGACWRWTAAKDGRGYGALKTNTVQRGAHRVSFETFNGPIGDGLHVLHRCDTPDCVNPEHLFIGTRSDNMKDCVAKGRNDGGAKKKLTETDVRWARWLYANGKASQRHIARAFKVSHGTIQNVISRKTWRHVG